MTLPIPGSQTLGLPAATAPTPPQGAVSQGRTYGINAATVEKMGRRARALLPPRLILHPDYFLVRKLCAASEAGNEAAYLPVIRERLRRVLTDAVTSVPYYRRGRITPAQCRNEDPFELIREFPYLSKAEVIADPDQFVSERVPRFMRYQKSSGGSSGQGIVLWRTKQIADVERAFLDNQWQRWGWSADHSRILRMGDDARRKLHETPAHRLHNRLMVSTLHLTEAWLPTIYDEAVKFAPEFIHSYTSCAVALARYIVDNSLPPLRVKGLMLTSEPLPAHWIPILHKAFAADISINYGMTERTNFAEATIRRGELELSYRINPIYAYQENHTHPDGRQEIVGTSYWNTVMPLIRYRTGDFGAIFGGQLEHMDGRDLEYLVTKQGGRVPGHSVEPDKSAWHKLQHLQLYQPLPGELVLRVVPKPGTTKTDLDQLLSTFEQTWADFFMLSLKIVEEIPKTPGGKTRYVVREGTPQEYAR